MEAPPMTMGFSTHTHKQTLMEISSIGTMESLMHTHTQTLKPSSMAMEDWMLQDWRLPSEMNKSVKDTHNLRKLREIKVVPDGLLVVVKAILEQSPTEAEPTNPVSSETNYTVRQRVVQLSSTALISAGKLLWQQFQRPNNEVNNALDVEAIQIREELTDIMHNIACEMSCGEEDFHNKTMKVLKSVESYSWDAKLVLILGAYSINYGQLRLIIEQCKNDKNNKNFVKYVALLKHISSEGSTDRLKSAENLIKNVINVIDCAVALRKNSKDLILKPMTNIQSAVYCTIYAVLFCGSIVTTISKGHVMDKKVEPERFTKTIESIQNHLKKQLVIGEKRIPIDKILSKKDKTDNMEVLQYLIGFDENITLICGNREEGKATVKSFHGKSVMFLISSFSIKAYEQEISFLYEFYIKTHIEKNYEIVWLPIVQQYDQITKEEYEGLISNMPWYAKEYKWLQVDQEVVDHVKKEWRFNETPMLVVIDQKGNLVQQDALDMIRIWGERSFSHFESREEEENILIKETNIYGLQFLYENIGIQLSNDGGYVCFYGGEDIEQLKELNEQVSRIKSETKVKIEMFYIRGNNGHTTSFNKIESEFFKDKTISQLEYEKTTQFWARLQSIVYLSSSRETNNNLDSVVRGAISLIAFDSSHYNWVAIGKAGSNNMVISQGKKFVESLNSVKNSEKFEGEEFLVRIDNAMKIGRSVKTGEQAHEEKHCIRVVLVGDSGKITWDDMSCTVCNRKMKKMVLYECCNE